MHTPGKVKFWQSRGQRFDPAILHQEKPWNHMVSRFFLIYGKLHKVAFVLNLCWTHGKIAHNYLFHATHFCNFFYIFIISTFYTNALIEKSFFAHSKKHSQKNVFFCPLYLSCSCVEFRVESQILRHYFQGQGHWLSPFHLIGAEQCVQITPIEIPLEVLPSTINSFSWCLYGLNGSH